ncbi:MAG: DUF4424 domain-containing protein [Rhizobiales bacterium]|nr:DUF4424 domain-containing protein [Hyphomicrobiales bacterium]
MKRPDNAITLMGGVAALLFASSMPGHGNDSTAEMGAGGLTMVRNFDVRMEKEELYISPEKVTVDYVFRNTAKDAREFLVAFPMPDIEPDAYIESDIGIPNTNSDNLLGFSVTIDGAAVEPKIDMRALSYGVDVTETIRSAGLPLNPISEATRKAVQALDPERREALAAEGIVYDDGSGPIPSWTLKSTYYWMQSFPPDRPVRVSHKYTPGTGSGFYYPGALDEGGYRDRYCIDKGTANAIARKFKEVGDGLLVERRVDYILKTGANWATPIGDFRLVVDKLKPDSIVSFCMDGVTKISPTRFEVRKKDFVPSADLRILVLDPHPPQ